MRRALLIRLALGVAICAAFAVALATGSSHLAPLELFQGLVSPSDSVAGEILFKLRLPRALAAFAAGGLLALAGVLMQVLLRNPLADPYVLGLSGGAAELHARYAGRPRVTVFYQIWDKPLMTINDDQLISDVIRLCGGENVFGNLKPLVPTIPTESVVTADPEAIIGSSAEVNTRGKLEGWKNWPHLKAVARDNLFVIHSDLISRHTPRVLQGAQQMCEHLETARSRRPIFFRRGRRRAFRGGVRQFTLWQEKQHDDYGGRGQGRCGAAIGSSCHDGLGARGPRADNAGYTVAVIGWAHYAEQE